MTDEARLIAYVDGELDAEAHARLEAEAAADPELAGAIARHRALRDAAAGAWADVLEEPVPERLRAAASLRAPSAAGVRRLVASARLPGLLQWAAMAACLAVGLVVGQALAVRGPLVHGPDGSLVARGALAGALSRQIGGQAAGQIKVGLSFRTSDRLYCRTFESRRDRLAGVACREHGRWTARALAAYQPPAASPDYKMAGASASPAVLAAVDALIAGEPLDAEAEAAARARGWSD